MSEKYTIRLLKSKHGLDKESDIEVDSVSGFSISGIDFKPFVAKQWIDKGEAIYVKKKKRIKVGD